LYASTRATLAAALVAAVTATAGLTGGAASAAPRAAHTEPVSVTAAGKAGKASSSEAVISRDGRFTAFASTASDLVPGDTNGASDVFVRDLRTGKLQRLAAGRLPSISANGRFVAYSTGGSFQLYDRRTHRTEQLDTGLPDGFGGAAGSVSLSANARYAVFTVGQAAGDGSVVFLRDRTKGTTERISAPKPTWEPRNAGDATVSDDGRYVVYQYNYANGPRGDDWGDVLLRDRRTGRLTQIDASHDGSTTERESLEPSISGDGRTVVFESADTHLVPDDTDKSWNVFVHDVASGRNERIHGTQGGPGAVYTRTPAVSSDGRYVTFLSQIAEPGSRWGTENPVYVRDLRTGGTVLVSPDTTGGTASADVAPGGIAAGAKRIAFTSGDDTLIGAGDTNDGQDVFVRRLR
jgi:Tol biopolymer transport system component